VARNHTNMNRKPSLARTRPMPQIQSGRTRRAGGPPRNRVTMMADMVTVFMNSARKNRAKRIEEYSVWKPPTSSCSASTRSKGGRFSSAVAAMTKITNGHHAGHDRFQLGTMPRKPSPAWATRSRWSTACRTAAPPPPRTGPARPRRTDHLRRGPHRAEQRVLRARRPAGQHHAVDGDRRHGQDEQDADGRVGQLQVGVAPEDRPRRRPAPSVKSPPIGITANSRNAGTMRQERGQDEHARWPGRGSGPP
jgi:hypothetical protein